MENDSTNKKGDTTSYEKAIEDYLEGKKVYDTYEKKACFVLGVLVKRVVEEQKENLNSAPFLNQLRGFNLSGLDDIKKLAGRASGKLIEYDANFESLVKVFRKYFEEVRRWNLSDTDLNFYILLGYVSKYELFPKKEQKQGGDEDE